MQRCKVVIRIGALVRKREEPHYVCCDVVPGSPDRRGVPQRVDFDIAANRMNTVSAGWMTRTDLEEAANYRVSRR
jgi:hypothetical protein